MSSARARSSLLPLLSSASYACGSDGGRDGRTPCVARAACKIHGSWPIGPSVDGSSHV